MYAMKRNFMVAFRQPSTPPVDCCGTSGGRRGDVAPPHFRFEFSASLPAILFQTKNTRRNNGNLTYNKTNN